MKRCLLFCIISALFALCLVLFPGCAGEGEVEIEEKSPDQSEVPGENENHQKATKEQSEETGKDGTVEEKVNLEMEPGKDIREVKKAIEEEGK
ncbi:MAG: hypothetical protein E3J78_01730 [Candidatus Cloacimonadota bacterium]|nr:MAG: hypothetical protein E3J78_01730 [Candidatus Cloacimonadota bacterium]